MTASIAIWINYFVFYFLISILKRGHHIFVIFIFLAHRVLKWGALEMIFDLNFSVKRRTKEWQFETKIFSCFFAKSDMDPELVLLPRTWNRQIGNWKIVQNCTSRSVRQLIQLCNALFSLIIQMKAKPKALWEHSWKNAPEILVYKHSPCVLRRGNPLQTDS